MRPADAQRHPSVADEDHAQALAGVEFVPFTGACVGNIDSDATLDVWTLSSRGELTHLVATSGVAHNYPADGGGQSA